MKKKKVTNKEQNKLIKPKEKIGTKFLETIKKRWLISSTNTILLIAILIAIVILINSFVQSLELTPIDCTSNKQYTITDETKNRIKEIDKQVNIYMAGYTEEDTTYTLVKQYNKVCKNINVEIIDLTERTDLADKYHLQNDYSAIVIESADKSKTLMSSDLSTYDSNYNTVDVTEEKVTSAILNVTSDKIAKVYFLTGFSEYSLDYSGGMYYFSKYLDDEVLEYETLDILVKKEIPADCNTLVITTPTKDFDDYTTNQIENYINNGGNILWLNSSYGKQVSLTNVNKILALYGINPFDVGYVYETDANRVVLGYSSCILEDLGNTKIDKNLNKVILLNATKINTNTEKMEELGIEEQKIISTADTTYFRKNISNTSNSTDGDEQGGFTVGGIYTKTISSKSENEENSKIVSNLVILGDNNFISDIQVASNAYPMILLPYDNKDLALNAIAYLTDNDEGITIRKDYNNVSSFTATDAQKSLIMKVVFAVPILIIIIGIIVWQVRRRKK